MVPKMFKPFRFDYIVNISAVRFIYNCTVESLERMKKEEGSGAILAHCMGLGKTLSVSTVFILSIRTLYLPTILLLKFEIVHYTTY